MTTIKSFTSLEQSRKLAEILPHESADMIWYGAYCGMDGQYQLLSNEYNEFGLIAINNEFCKNLFRPEDKYVDWLPCWSLAALLDILPDELEDDHFLTLDKEGKEYCCCYEDGIGNSFKHKFADNPVDACVEMIIKLHELNLL